MHQRTNGLPIGLHELLILGGKFKFSNMAKLCQEVDQLIGIINEQNLAIGDVMKRLERLHFSDTVALSLQAKLMTRLANCQLFTPNNYHEAEQRVNGLLKYLSSQNYTVCTLACSLMRVFCAFLDRNGQHIATQGSSGKLAHILFLRRIFFPTGICITLAIISILRN